jgi:hypothetical protein
MTGEYGIRMGPSSPGQVLGHRDDLRLQLLRAVGFFAEARTDRPRHIYTSVSPRHPRRAGRRCRRPDRALNALLLLTFLLAAAVVVIVVVAAGGSAVP